MDCRREEPRGPVRVWGELPPKPLAEQPVVVSTTAMQKMEEWIQRNFSPDIVRG